MSRKHRRIRKTRLQTIYVRNRRVTKDSEGVPTESFDAAYSLQAEIWPASERRQIEIYGDRVTGISNVRIQGDYTICELPTDGIIMTENSDIVDTNDDALLNENSDNLVVENKIAPGDGICVNVASDATPDYRVLTITPYCPVRLEIERI